MRGLMREPMQGNARAGRPPRPPRPPRSRATRCFSTPSLMRERAGERGTNTTAMRDMSRPMRRLMREPMQGQCQG